MPPQGENPLEALLRSFREDPEGYEVNKKIGLYMSGIRKHQLHAEPHILKALSHNIKDADTKHLLQSLAHVHNIKGAFEAAASVYKTAIATCPEAPDFVYWLGDALFRVGEYEDSSKALGAAIKSRLEAAERNARARAGPVIHLLEPSKVICRFIGELASKIDTYLKARALGLFKADEAILLADKADVSNMRLLEYWKDHITVVTDKDKMDELRKVHGDDWVYLDYYTLADGLSLHRYTAETAIQNQWEAEGRPPLLELKDFDRERGWARLRAAGVPEDAWFAVLHVRDADFYDEDVEWSFNRHRNADIETYVRAIEEITSSGGWVIRLGGPGAKPLPRMDKVIDYANSDLRTDWMDIFLIAESRFYVGMGSGPMSVAMAFGKPIVGTNWIHLGHWPYRKEDIFIHKTLRAIADGRTLSLRESLEPPFSGALEPLFFQSRGVEPMDNTPEEIREVVVEMLERQEGGLTYSKEDERRQRAFKSAIAIFGIEPSSRAGSAFLKRHLELISK